jgi:Zinc finger, C3HC4 type (RING finger)
MPSNRSASRRHSTESFSGTGEETPLYRFGYDHCMLNIRNCSSVDVVDEQSDGGVSWSSPDRHPRTITTAGSDESCDSLTSDDAEENLQTPSNPMRDVPDPDHFLFRAHFLIMPTLLESLDFHPQNWSNSPFGSERQQRRIPREIGSMSPVQREMLLYRRSHLFLSPYRWIMLSSVLLSLVLIILMAALSSRRFYDFSPRLYYSLNTPKRQNDFQYFPSHSSSMPNIFAFQWTNADSHEDTNKDYSRRVAKVPATSASLVVVPASSSSSPLFIDWKQQEQSEQSQSDESDGEEHEDNDGRLHDTSTQTEGPGDREQENDNEEHALRTDKQNKKSSDQLISSMSPPPHGSTPRQGSQLANPQFYGWTPNVYPNPITHPSRCGIAYLHNPYGHDNGSNDTISREIGDNGFPTGPSITEIKQDDADGPLRLCDPDWVLGGFHLEQVARALYNFSFYFGPGRHPASDDDVLSNVTSSEGEHQESEESSNGKLDGDEHPADDSWDVEILNPQQKGHGNGRSWRHLRSGGLSKTRQPGRQLQEEASDIDGVEATNRSKEDAQNRRSQFLWRGQLWWKALQFRRERRFSIPDIQLAVATVRKMNIPAVLRSGLYYAYEDQDDMVNDAAQIFARRVHEEWWDEEGSNNAYKSKPSDRSLGRSTSGDYGVLIFLSVQDRVCFIATGIGISSILPWWRLDHIVGSMKSDLQVHSYGDALVMAISDLSAMLESGPPTVSDRVHDFVARFGVVISFAVFTFVFGAWGEYRDRRKRWQFAEKRSMLTYPEREKARKLQQGYKTKACPICLEEFETGEQFSSADVGFDPLVDENTFLVGVEGGKRRPVKRVDSLGIPLEGADGKNIKMLRCGHIFCETCWAKWVRSGIGNPANCAVCRQDVGKPPRKSRARRIDDARGLDMGAAAVPGGQPGTSGTSNEESTNDSSQECDESTALNRGLLTSSLSTYGTTVSSSTTEATTAVS